ncbi:MAG TPA: phosphoglycerate kinase [Candidatus Eisenbacteria bacterium]|uniref:Phosphoglycerate kinase n=1 Tax=Eiseniibacteriota bacterium TaxID=2212470 RepID=A0A7V2AWD0_UNCEI|nr:phosphoglycerate kinase [Candidatus Eisenbacteria bacterium]
MRKKTLRDVELAGRRVLMRVDFNVPLSKRGDVTDDTRIRAALPSIDHIIASGASLVLMSHLGRPKGQRNPAMSLNVAAYHLGGLIDHPVKFVEDCVGDEAEEAALSLQPGEILLLENLRFHSEETANDPVFSKTLSRYGDLYANDAFGTAHRAHASTEGVTRYFDERVAGFLMEKELETLESLISDPERPFVALIGGAKVSGKIGLIENLLDRVDRVLIGGGMAYTFFKAVGLEIGASLVDDESLDLCRKIMDRSSAGGEKKIFLPVDTVVAKSIDDDSDMKTVSTGDMPEDLVGVDIGAKTIEVFSKELAGAKTIFWNGPMGVFEEPSFAEGTRRIARTVAEMTGRGAMTVVGGGDSVAALGQLRLKDRITHVSTGGGASLELLEGKKLPGVEALSDKT